MSDSVGAILSCFVVFEWRVLSWECWRGEVWVDAMALVERWVMVPVYGGVATLSCMYVCKYTSHKPEPEPLQTCMCLLKALER